MEKTHQSPTTSKKKIPLKTWKKVTVLERATFAFLVLVLFRKIQP